MQNTNKLITTQTTANKISIATHTLRAGLGLLLLGAACIPAWAATSTLNPTADAYVRGGSYASTNYGTAATLTMQTSSTAANNFDSYLKFDTTSVPNITNAKLRLYAALNTTGSVASTACAVADTTWGETALTWNNKPARGTALGTITVASTTYAWYEIDVTTYVQSEFAAGRKVVSFAYHDGANSTPLINAYSKETANKPQLLITYNVAPTVSLTAPANNTVVTAPATITLAATATDDGTISKVEFYNGTTLLNTDTTAAYGYIWS
ncbi:MAG: DNRLRE domain-containing protein, partial [Gallionellaceae bacterium]|nr:DNRLRE domain-containing protein [Gallionellaceae bacterium]